MPALFDRYMASLKVATNTLKTYTVCMKRLKVVFEEFSPDEVKPKHLYTFFTQKNISKAMSAHYRSVMIGAMQQAVREGLVERNLMREVESFAIGARQRYITDEEYLAIFAKASPTMQCLMDILYLTGQRIGDVLAIRYADLGKDGITFEQEKTKTRLTVAWSPDLESAVLRVKSLHQSVKGLTLFHTRTGGKLAYSTVRTLWDRAILRSEIENAHIHDIRAKSATDAKKQGVDSMALLGHKSESVHQRYLRNKDTPIVQGIKNLRQSG